MKAIAVIVIPTLMLGGCSSISATAEKLGVNFWSNSPMKAPCKVAASVGAESFCIGEAIEKPDPEELNLLRGLYLVETLDPPEFFASNFNNQPTGLAP